MRYAYLSIVISAVLMVSSCAIRKQSSVIQGEAPKAITEVTKDVREGGAPPTMAETAERSYRQREDRKTYKPVLIKRDQTDEDRISLSFENTDIHTVIDSFGKLMGINYIVSPGITGMVTIQSNKKFSSGDLYQVFLSVLELNSLTAVKDGDFYRIVPIDTAKQQPIDVKDEEDAQIMLDSSFITQIITLDYVKATEAVDVLKSFMSRGTDIIVYQPANMLIITALPKTLLKFLKIIEAIDIPDAEVESVKTFIYHAENGEAKKLEGILNGIFSEKGRNSASKSIVAAKASEAGSMTSVQGDAGEISISTYEDLNALIIKCTPRDYLSVLEILKKVDVSPKQPMQVLIEAMIAEVNLTDSFEFGLEWLLKTRSGDTVGYTTAPVETPPTIVTGHPGGFAAVVSGAAGHDLFNYVLSAIEGKTDVNVLGTPLVFAVDGKRAEITIGSEVPTATSTTTSTEGISTTTQIQYRSVGILLQVTPEITDKGSVAMDISVESSDVIEAGRTIGTGTFPQFQSRRATTSAVVQDGQTLFLGGLISDKIVKRRTGVPILSRIPILGLMFSSSSNVKMKSELFVMVTPHIISSREDADIISQQYKDRVTVIREKLDMDMMK